VRHIAFRTRKPRDRRFDILTVARLHPEKGIEHGLRAVAALARRRPSAGVHYCIIGDGEDGDRLRLLTKRLGLGRVVEFLGPLSTPDVMDWMHASDLFLLPSLAGGTPTVLLEAQATGLPIVATDVGGVRDIVRPGAGFVVEPDDCEALADRLMQLIDHPERWPEMGRAGHRFVAEHHDIVELDSRLSHLLEGLVRDACVPAADVL
jgi:colanic acid/amylovoran biosynthesis glycosyltransferase